MKKNLSPRCGIANLGQSGDSSLFSVKNVHDKNPNVLHLELTHQTPRASDVGEVYETLWRACNPCLVTESLPKLYM